MKRVLAILLTLALIVLGCGLFLANTPQVVESARIQELRSKLDGASGAPNLSQELIRLSKLSEDFDSTTRFMSPDSKKSVEEWSLLAERLWLSCPPWEHLSLALISEMDSRLAEKGSGSIPELLPSSAHKALSVPGLLAREKRIYTNHMVQLILDLEERKSEKPLSQTASLWAIWTGKQGFFTGILVPERTKAQALSDSTRGKIMGLSMAAALCAFRSKNGSFPEEISELATLKLALPSHDERQEFGLGYHLSQNGALLWLQLPPGGQDKRTWGLANSGQSWVTEEGGRLNFVF